MNWLIHIAVQIAAMGIFLLLTRHPDFREERWTKIAWSAFFAFSITAALLGQINDPFVLSAASIGGLGLLVLTWTGTLSQWAAHHQVNFFYRDIHSYTGLRADFKFAINHRRDGELKEAVKAVRQELLKEPANFEGLLLLAQIYQDLNEPVEAMTPLQKILNAPALSESQRALAQNELANCKRLIDLRTIEEFNRRPNT